MATPKFYLVVTFSHVLLLISHVKAQNALGPFDAYVSRQNPAQTRILSGEFPFKAAKGQQGKFPESSIQGPIAIDALANEPVTKKSKKEKTATKSTIRVTHIPVPGTTVPAQFLIKSENFLSWLLPKSDKGFSKGMVVKFDVHSLLLKMSRDEISLSKGGSVIVSVAKRYPVSDGSVTYQSLNDNVRLTPLSQGVRITGFRSGDDVIVASLTVGGAVFRDTIKAKIPALQVETSAASNQVKPLSGPTPEDVKIPQEKTKEDLIQMNQASQQEIVRLQYKVNKSERILFAGALFLLAALITLGIRSYIRHERRHKRTMDEISQMQSHKVRAPIARILGLTQLFNSSDPTDPVNEEVITYITSTTADLDRVITEIIKKSDAHLRHTVARKSAT